MHVAVTLIFDDNFRILVGKRLKTGLFIFPGGKQEENEDLQETAWRETLEETGLDVDVLEFLGYHHTPNFTLHIFCGRASQMPSTVEPDKHWGWAFRKIKDVPSMDPINSAIFEDFVPLALKELNFCNHYVRKHFN